MPKVAVLLPELGTGPDVPIVVSHWYAVPGEEVFEGDRLVELLVGPATLNLSAPSSGTLVDIQIAEDESVPPGAVLGHLLTDSVERDSDGGPLKNVEDRPP